MRVDEELQKHTLNLYRGDYAKLQEMEPDVGAGPLIRQIVRAYILQYEIGLMDKLSKPDVEIGL